MSFGLTATGIQLPRASDFIDRVQTRYEDLTGEVPDWDRDLVVRNFLIAVADEFGMAFAHAKGTPECPLVEPEDLYEARIVAVSAVAAGMGIAEGMTGSEALAKMLAAGS